MQLKFDANQDYQLRAIESIADLFIGQPPLEAAINLIGHQVAFGAVVNQLDLTDEELLTNLQAVQQHNQITPDSYLRRLEGEMISFNGTHPVSFYNFSVDMETGTGKTYVYLRTALELCHRYGFRKYIVVVPSVAVREGVLKTLAITRTHFQQLYGNLPYRYYAYDSANLTQVRQFAGSDSLEIMVMTIDAFNKAANVIYQTTDRLQGETPIHLIQAVRPILILDEPQNMESERSIAALAALNPLMALRYSATHRTPYNIVYRLSPFQAYQQGLVKQIEVASILKEGDTEQPYIRLIATDSKKNTVTARLAIHKLMRGGTIKETEITVRREDSLEEKTNRSEYAGYIVDEINPLGRYIRFTNNKELNEGQETGADKEAIFDAQIRYTLETHFQKQARLRDAGIKVLSLFFIDKVDNYAPADGFIRRLFNENFEKLKQVYPDWQQYHPNDIQAAYFAQRRTRSGEVILEDSSSGEAQKDQEAYDLIMKDKERLLSLGESTAFIFSHSALREGWDNPNVFQICTLNQTVSDVKKRQEVGRGVRLAVDQSGGRIHDQRVNVLTVVANESYEKYVSQLQTEIAAEIQAEIEARYGKPLAELTDAERAAVEQEYGQILPPKPNNANRRGHMQLNKQYYLDPQFKALWDRICQKTRYNVTLDTARLIVDVVAAVEYLTVKPPRIAVTKVGLQVTGDSLFQTIQLSGAKDLASLAGRFPLPNLVDIMTNLLQFTTPPVRLTRHTLLEIINRLSPHQRQAALENPNDFANQVVPIIRAKLLDQLINGVKYQKINDYYEMTEFKETIPGVQEYLIPASKSLYDYVEYESSVERDFVTHLESREDVQLYIKLPAWFTVPTPVGQYNPDWAIIIQDPHQPDTKPRLYLVRETKSTCDLDDLRPDEARKIKYGHRHFEELGVNYHCITSAADLPTIS